MNSSGEYLAPESAFLRRVGCSGRRLRTAPGDHSCERNRLASILRHKLNGQERKEPHSADDVLPLP
ncbi:hypothetical protein ABZ357_20170 [Streptomyces sp. NPDC005917]|uniref:hypothetical protein n=1 Tax=unclassified Streptomyces TaxID=2593676 RepID=UPI00340581FA